MGRGQNTASFASVTGHSHRGRASINGQAISSQLKRRFAQIIEHQPERFIVGNDWAARVYTMSTANKRQKARVLNQLRNSQTTLSKADLKFLYAAIAYASANDPAHSAPGKFGHANAYSRLHQGSSFWSKAQALFEECGIKSTPDYEHAWED